MADNKLRLVEETNRVLWSVRTNGSVFLVVLTELGHFDVHAVMDGGVEFIGEAATHEKALELIQTECDG